MNPTSLGTIFVGDAWKQAVAIQQTNQDFTGFVLGCELYSVTAPPAMTPVTPVPTVTGTLATTITTNDTINAVLSLSSANTSSLGVGFYIGRLRLTLASSSFGPTTIFEFSFRISA
jgi:hypothetical protein